MAALKKTPSSRAKLTTGQRKEILARHRLGEGGKKKTKVVVRRKTAVKKAVAKKKTSPLELRKSQKNPIIEPERSAYWESKATFNPSAVYSDGKVHVIYRAIGDSDISVLGYARSDNGYLFDKNSKKIAYYQKGKFAVRKDAVKINYISGGGWGGGCEDPRLTLLSDKVYMLYTAFDGWGSVRIALTSISLDDFIGRRFDWKEPVLISPPGEIHKNWVLFPEKIKGKYAILHSISPHIMIDYFSSLDELHGENFIHSVHQGSPLWSARDKLIRGVGPAPIKTRYGWLVLYHKMEKHDTHRYKLWAMILDLKDPAKILYNSRHPILEPDEWYENEGYKAGVVYAYGAVVKPARPDDSSRSGGDELFVYYGGADKVSCVATANLDAFLKELVYSGASKLKSRKS